MSEAQSWQHMWGAKVKMPCDMDDDILEDTIKHVISKLSQFDNDTWEEKGLAVSTCTFLFKHNMVGLRRNQGLHGQNMGTLLGCMHRTQLWLLCNPCHQTLHLLLLQRKSSHDLQSRLIPQSRLILNSRRILQSRLILQFYIIILIHWKDLFKLHIQFHFPFPFLLFHLCLYKSIHTNYNLSHT